MSSELSLFQLAQRITDEVLGKDYYRRANKFDPSKGETYQQPSVAKPKEKESG